MRTWAALGFILVVANLVSAQHALGQSCVEAPPGLIAWWPFDNSANDIVGANNPAPSSGPITYVPAKVDTGADNNLAPLGISILKTPNLNLLGSDFSIEAWVLITKPAIPGQIFVNYVGVPAYMLFITEQNKAVVHFRPGVDLTGPGPGPDVGVTATGNTTLNVGQWYHLVGVRSGATAAQAGATASIYVNGKLDATATNPAVLSVNRGSVDTGRCMYARIGAHRTDNDHCTSPTATPGYNHFSGVIDEVGIFNRALSQKEIQALYAAGAAGKCKPSGSAKGMTWRWGGVNATTGTVIVGCGASDPVHPCNGYVGDQSCADSLPLLCFKPNPILPKPRSVVETPYYYLWSGGIVGTTAPVAPAAAPIMSSLTNANKICADEFGAGWRVAEFHDGAQGKGGWDFLAYGNMGDPKTRFWVHINDQPKGTCFTKK